MSELKRPWLKAYNPMVKANLDYPTETLPEILEKNAVDYPDVVAYIFAGKSVTYREYNEQVGRLATALSRLGIKKGDRVALMAPNSPFYLISFFAIIKIGAVVVQTNPMYTEREVGHQLIDSGAETIIVYDALYPRVAAVRAKTNLRNVLVFSLGQEVPAQGENVHKVEQLLFSTPNEPPEVTINLKEDLAVFQYTGGTTGASKGAMLTHQNILYNAYMTRMWTNDAKIGQETSMGVLPLFHSFGMSNVMNFAMLSLGTIILVPQFDAHQILELIKQYRPTFFHGVPTMYTALLAQPDLQSYDLSSIRACISGGAAMPVEVMQKFQEVTGAEVLEGYGLSEASPTTHCNPLGGVSKAGSIGIPFPDTDCKIVDIETGEKEMPVGEAGELIIKGPQVMKGYWNMPDETAATIRDGWLFTGDIAKMDEDGYFYIIDRKKEMIVAGGYNIYPREVEEVLYEMKGVSEAAVAGIPDEYRGETVWAFVVKSPGQDLTEEEIIKFCREKMAAYKAPRKVIFLDELPKTAVGKILRRELAKMAAK